MTEQTSGRLPDAGGHFGIYGGKFVSETLMYALSELEEAYQTHSRDEGFQKELACYFKDFVGRPSPLYFAETLSGKLGINIYLKREDLNHTGAHKINNTVGQILLAKKMGKKRIIAETGAGQHGVATATVAAQFGLECEVFMGSKDVQRQSANVLRMNILGAKVTPVDSGTCTLKDAMNEAIRNWITHVEHTFYVIGSVAGPHPYPMMVRDFQKVIGIETRQQILDKVGRLPDIIAACVGGGSNAIGIFFPFIDDPGVKLVGVEAAGGGIDAGPHSASLAAGSPGVLHGAMSYVLQSRQGQILDAHSIAPGLDYPGVGPEHSYLKDIDRVDYTMATDREALEAFNLLSRTEGIIPALESAHAVAYLIRTAAELNPDTVAIINLSGRGDKDISIVNEMKNKF